MLWNCFRRVFGNAPHTGLVIPSLPLLQCLRGGGLPPSAAKLTLLVRHSDDHERSEGGLTCFWSTRIMVETMRFLSPEPTSREHEEMSSHIALSTSGIHEWLTSSSILAQHQEYRYPARRALKLKNYGRNLICSWLTCECLSPGPIDKGAPGKKPTAYSVLFFSSSDTCYRILKPSQ